MGKVELFPRHSAGLVGPERDLPHSEWAEQAVLGVVLNSPKNFVMAESLEPKHFYFPVHGRIWGEAVRRILANQVADPITMRAWLESDPEAGKNASSILAGLTASVLHNKIDGYAAQIKDMYLRRQAITKTATYLERLYDLNQPFAESTIQFQDELDAIIQNVEETDICTFADALNKAETWIEKAIARGGKAGLDIPHYPRLNKHLRFYEQQLTILGGASGEGKSALGWSIAINAAEQINQQITPEHPLSEFGGIVGFSLEMSEEMLSFRAVSALSGISVADLESGNLNRFQLEEFRAAKATLSKLPVTLIAMGGLTPTMMRMRMRQARRKLGGKIAMILIDHVQLVSADDKDARGGGAWATGKVADAILGLAKEFDTHVLALSQVDTKSIRNRPDKRPMIEDLRWSENFRQNADNVAFVYRHEIHLPPEPIQDSGMPDSDYRDMLRKWQDDKDRHAGRGEVYGAKSRNGPSQWSIKMYFDGRTTTFTEDPDQ